MRMSVREHGSPSGNATRQRLDAPGLVPSRREIAGKMPLGARLTLAGAISLAAGLTVSSLWLWAFFIVDPGNVLLAVLAAVLAALSVGAAIHAARKARRWQAASERDKNVQNELTSARERAEAASLAKSQFLATVSHEIRTPLNGITGMARLLADTPLTNEQRTYVEAVISSSNSLLGLIEDILDFSKIEAGKIDIEPEPLQLREFCEGIAELMSARAFAKNIGLGLTIGASVPSMIEVDALRLRQALLNLLGNAVKFTEAGGVSLLVKHEEGRLIFTVSDTGPGIAPEEQERIFGEFEQTEAGATRRHGGAGLGLAITKRIAEAMNGGVSVESRPGHGSAFALWIPIVNDSPRLMKPARLAGTDVQILTSRSVESETLAANVLSEGGTAHIAQSITDLDETAGSILVVDAVMAERLVMEHAILAGAFAHKVILIEPKDRGALAHWREQGFSAFLARPVRLESLVRVLTGNTSLSRDIVVPPPRAVKPELEGEPLRILLAEDNDINALLVRATLERAGHEVVRVADGKSAVAQATGGFGRFDAILMDLHMPEMDGIDAIAAIRASEEQRSWPAAPIFALTADGQAEAEASVRAVGGTGFITKPVDPFKLLAIVEEAASV
jgi:signal transduction histidine kinase/CheY-like chemotaxis protein